MIKLSRITKAEKLYRGVAGFRLPDEFLTPDSYGVAGGVEFGFSIWPQIELGTSRSPMLEAVFDPLLEQCRQHPIGR